MPARQRLAGATASCAGFKFADHYITMTFVNAVAWVSHQQGHHPDLAVGYNTCRVEYMHPRHQRPVGIRLHLRRQDRRAVPALMQGTVVAVHGHHFLVEGGDGAEETRRPAPSVSSPPRGAAPTKAGAGRAFRMRYPRQERRRGLRRSCPVRVTAAAKGDRANRTTPQTCFNRSDEFKAKLIAAMSIRPPSSSRRCGVPRGVLIRCLVACEWRHSHPDRAEQGRSAGNRSIWRASSRPTSSWVTIVAGFRTGRRQHTGTASGWPHHGAGGASGVGKSTLLNRLVPQANATTGRSRWPWMPAPHTTCPVVPFCPTGGDLVDSPACRNSA